MQNWNEDQYKHHLISPFWSTNVLMFIFLKQNRASIKSLNDEKEITLFVTGNRRQSLWSNKLSRRRDHIKQEKDRESLSRVNLKYTLGSAQKTLCRLRQWRDIDNVMNGRWYPFSSSWVNPIIKSIYHMYIFGNYRKLFVVFSMLA